MARKRKAVGGARGATPLQPAAAIVLYDRKTGAIFGTHYFGAADGIELPNREELERIALAHAAQDGCQIKQVKALQVEPTALRPGCHYAVSLKTRKPSLVERKRRSGKQTVSAL